VFDTIVLDLLLVNEDGGRLLEEIKTRSKFQDIRSWSTPARSSPRRRRRG